MNLEDKAKKIFAEKRSKKGISHEIFLGEWNSRHIAWAEGHPEDTQYSNSQGLSFRVIEKGRHGMACANSIEKETASKVFDRALSVARIVGPDKHRFFIQPDGNNGKAEKAEDIFEKGVPDWHICLRDLERKVLGSDRRIKKVIRMGVAESAGSVGILNSNGLEKFSNNNFASFGIEIVAESDEEVQIGSGYVKRRRVSDIAFDSVAEQTANRAVGLLGAKPVSSRSMSVVFDPYVGADFLGFLAGTLCADSVQRKRSVFMDNMGERVASDFVNIVDDGFLKGGIASFPFDSEGCRTGRVELIKDGILCGYLYDSYTASQDGKESSGNATRSISTLPSPGPSNFFMVPGKAKPEEIAFSLKYGLLLRDVIGMHTANPISGDFSVGAVGQLIENGKLTKPVRGITLAGNILDLLKGIDAVADDLTWYTSIASPTFKVKELSVGGV